MASRFLKKTLGIFDHSRLVHILLLGFSFLALIVSVFFYILLNQEVDLSHLKTENIKIVCPLSYGGNKNYVRKVIKIAKRIYGDKFYPLW